jgi:hypothetical protein
VSIPLLNETAIHRYLRLASERNNDSGLSTLGADAAFIDNEMMCGSPVHRCHRFQLTVSPSRYKTRLFEASIEAAIH